MRDTFDVLHEKGAVPNPAVAAVSVLPMSRHPRTPADRSLRPRVIPSQGVSGRVGLLDNHDARRRIHTRQGCRFVFGQIAEEMPDPGLV